jgi:hypothetical protein
MQVGDLVQLIPMSGDPMRSPAPIALVFFRDSGLALLWSDGDTENINRSYENVSIRVISESR